LGQIKRSKKAKDANSYEVLGRMLVELILEELNEKMNAKLRQVLQDKVKGIVKKLEENFNNCYLPKKEEKIEYEVEFDEQIKNGSAKIPENKPQIIIPPILPSTIQNSNLNGSKVPRFGTIFPSVAYLESDFVEPLNPGLSVMMIS